MRIIATIGALVGLLAFAQAANSVELTLEQRSVYPGEFSPKVLTVKKGEPVRLLVTSKAREHVNRISILPWVARSETLSGKPTVIEFTPDQTGDFEIRNIGHGFTATLRVVE